MTALNCVGRRSHLKMWRWGFLPWCGFWLFINHVHGLLLGLGKGALSSLFPHSTQVQMSNDKHSALDIDGKCDRLGVMALKSRLTAAALVMVVIVIHGMLQLWSAEGDTNCKRL